MPSGAAAVHAVPAYVSMPLRSRPGGALLRTASAARIGLVVCRLRAEELGVSVARVGPAGRDAQACHEVPRCGVCDACGTELHTAPDGSGPEVQSGSGSGLHIRQSVDTDCSLRHSEHEAHGLGSVSVRSPLGGPPDRDPPGGGGHRTRLGRRRISTPMGGSWRPTAAPASGRLRCRCAEGASSRGSHCRVPPSTLAYRGSVAPCTCSSAFFRASTGTYVLGTEGVFLCSPASHPAVANIPSPLPVGTFGTSANTPGAPELKGLGLSGGKTQSQGLVFRPGGRRGLLGHLASCPACTCPSSVLSEVESSVDEQSACSGSLDAVTVTEWGKLQITGVSEFVP